MIKLIIFLLTFLSISLSFSIEKPSLNLISLSSTSITQEGLSIDSTIKHMLLDVIEQAFVRKGNDVGGNAQYISQILSNSTTVSGNWNIVITSNCTFPSGYGAYSYQGSWWAYWLGVNQYAPDWCYFMTRMPKSSTFIKYYQQTSQNASKGSGISAEDQTVIDSAIVKAYSIYKTSVNGNAFYVSDKLGADLGGSWDVLVLNNTSQFYSYSYNVDEKWTVMKDVTQLNRVYFIRKVWNLA